MRSKVVYTSKVGLDYIGNQSVEKKLILICELSCVWGIAHFIIHSASLDCSFPFLILLCYVRLVYCMSNFQIVGIVLTSLIKDTFCLQLR